ncbi:FprA family A-type flavoprotein [Vulcanisaeta souniana]|uniref:MBL fold metallo-hydrolase n=1 Tax=Vulcanisaeta souniana JCM 11219 TaxID=1293586 RepID=A0A830E886_9CREN|nr:FprA family A-type flavoprotein [Vulcanisaeta souniana]BDR91151.1 MBL fold metallo-hydrolase [Vulcanisaeta souniana JCM 11219]GGI81233.1 MBL fold metallo-hydrolase [Vulcanisaeta souniana JCM 11219]
MRIENNIVIDKVSKDLIILRYNDTTTRYFEALWEIPEGVTYNAYLLTDDDTTVLFDTWKKNLENEFLNALNSIIDISDLDYVVIHHMESDHSGSIRALYEKNPRITFIGHPMTNKLIRSLYGINPKFKAIRDGETLSTKNYQLMFIHVPWLHWPETMFTYIPQIRALLTCDVFGAYTIPKSVFIEKLDDEYISSMRKYFANIIGFYRNNVTKNLDKVLTMTRDNIDMIAPAHGAVIKGNIVKRSIGLYREFALKTPINRKIVIAYSSMYGFIDNIMSHVTHVLNDWGFNTSVYRFTDKERASIGDLIGDVNNVLGIILGVSTYDTEPFPLMDFVINLLIKKLRGGKPILLITDYGWGDVIPRHIRARLEKAGFTVIDTISVNGTPTKEDLNKIDTAIQNFKQIITQ